METAKKINVTFDVTLSNAKEWYNSGNKALKEIALKCFSESELNPPPYSEIKTFEDAVKFLGMNVDGTNAIVNILKETSKATAAMYKLNLIRKTLNLGQDLHLTKNPEHSYIYYPVNRLATEDSIHYKFGLTSDNTDIIGKVKCEGKKYYVTGGHTFYSGHGLGGFFRCGIDGTAPSDIAFLGCASEEIARHFGKYFGMLITEAKFGDMFDFEIIEDKYGNA